MTDIKFNCPHCDQHINAPVEMADQTAACPSCGKQIKVPSLLKVRTKPSIGIDRPQNQPSPVGKTIENQLESRATGMATASLVCGLIGLAYPSSILILSSIAGVVCGHLAFERIRHSPDKYAGIGKAKAGLVLSYLALAIGLTIGFIQAYYRVSIKALMAGHSGRGTLPIALVVILVAVILVLILVVVFLTSPTIRVQQPVSVIEPICKIDSQQNPLSPEAIAALKPIAETTGLMAASFFVVTLGLYAPYWFLSRRNTLTSLKSNLKLGTGVFVLLFILFFLSLFSYFTRRDYDGLSKVIPFLKKNPVLSTLGGARKTDGGWTRDEIEGANIFDCFIPYNSTLLLLQGGADLMRIAAKRRGQPISTIGVIGKLFAGPGRIDIPFVGYNRERSLVYETIEKEDSGCSAEDFVRIVLFLVRKEQMSNYFSTIGVISWILFLGLYVTVIPLNSTKVRKMLIDHVKAESGQEIKISPDGAFFLNVIYLQHLINRLFIPMQR